VVLLLLLPHPTKEIKDRDKQANNKVFFIFIYSPLIN